MMTLAPSDFRVAVINGGCSKRQNHDDADRSKRDGERQSGVASDAHALADVNTCSQSPSNIIHSLVSDSGAQSS